MAERRTALERKGKNQKQDAASLGSSPGKLHFYSIGLESASERESQPWRWPSLQRHVTLPIVPRLFAARISSE